MAVLEYNSAHRPSAQFDVGRLMLGAVCGFTLGIFLTFISFIATGAGHGTYVVLGLCAAPFSALDDVLLALIGVPVFWTCLGGLVGGSGHPVARLIAVVLLLAHFVSAPHVLTQTEFADWDYLPRAGEFGYVGLGIYGVGIIGALAVLAWNCLGRSHPR
jgi:hypothetical protein